MTHLPRIPGIVVALTVTLGLVLFSDDAAADTPNFAVAPQIGMVAPQAFGDFDPALSVGIDMGAILPFDVGPFHHPLQLGMELAYTAPSVTGTSFDPMLGEDGDHLRWELHQRTVSLQMTAIWRFLGPGESLGVHLLVGPRIYLMESVLEGSADQGGPIADHRETNTEYGLAAGLGGEFRLGPGSLTTTLSLSRSPLNQSLTGPTTTAALHLQGGYRFFF